MTRVEQIIQDLREAGTSPHAAFSGPRRNGERMYIGGGVVTRHEYNTIIMMLAPRGGVVMDEGEKARQRARAAAERATR